MVVEARVRSRPKRLVMSQGAVFRDVQREGLVELACEMHGDPQQLRMLVDGAATERRVMYCPSGAVTGYGRRR